jgi:hypothetical protein
MLPLVNKYLHMKKIVYISVMMALLAITTNNISAQIRKIPAEVTNAFTAKYPNATSVEWRDKLSGFTATFALDSADFQASFNNKGEWEYTEEEIELSELPTIVSDGFDKSRYHDWNVGQVTKIEFPDDKVQYKIAVSKGDIKKRNLYFTDEGRLLKDKLTI